MSEEREIEIEIEIYCTFRSTVFIDPDLRSTLPVPRLAVRGRGSAGPGFVAPQSLAQLIRVQAVNNLCLSIVLLPNELWYKTSAVP